MLLSYHRNYSFCKPIATERFSTLEKSYATSRWENEGGATRPSAIGFEIGQKLAAHGITAIPLTVYEWSGYRYSSANDAIAAAERNIR
jgi:hypothetical protein